MIEVRDIHKRFGDVTALDGLGFTAPDGAITGLLGPNGAGKTTALRCIYGLTRPDRGQLAVDGHDVGTELMAVRAALGVFTDKFGLYDRLTAREQLAYFAGLNGIPRPARSAAVDRIVARLGIQDIADRRSDGFSQGQRMKVGLGRALVHDPGNLVLDEPTRGLDVMSTRNLRSLLRNLRDEGRCVLFSSHVMAEVAALCDHVVIVRAGRLCAEGSPEELCARAGEADLEETFIRLIGTAEGIAA